MTNPKEFFASAIYCPARTAEGNFHRRVAESQRDEAGKIKLRKPGAPATPSFSRGAHAPSRVVIDAPANDSDSPLRKFRTPYSEFRTFRPLRLCASAVKSAGAA